MWIDFNRRVLLWLRWTFWPMGLILSRTIYNIHRQIASHTELEQCSHSKLHPSNIFNDAVVIKERLNIHINHQNIALTVIFQHFLRYNKVLIKWLFWQGFAKYQMIDKSKIICFQKIPSTWHQHREKYVH